MCTVTFIPAADKVFITHNRDEKSLRSKAIYPSQYIHDDKALLYPKDSQAGGSWIAVNDDGNVAVLLNGGFKKHIPSPPYRKSRGLIFLEIAKSSDLKEEFETIDLAAIEPFTIILWNNGKLYECRWDGEKKYSKQADASMPHIWSSVTLYTDEMIEHRKEWFESWLVENTDPSANDILDFHFSAGREDKENGLCMNRKGEIEMLTVSVTSIELAKDKAMMNYFDLPDNIHTHLHIDFSETTLKEYRY